MNLRLLRDWFFPKSYYGFPEIKHAALYKPYEQHRERMVKNALIRCGKYGSPEKLLVDVGASMGRFSEIASSLAYKVVAVEIRRDFAVYIEKHIDCMVIIASTDALPFRSHVANVILSLELLEHLGDVTLEKATREYKRVVSADGYLLVSTPNFASLLGLVTLFVGRLTKQPSYKVMERDHVRYFTSASLVAFLKEKAYLLQEIIGTYYLPIPHVFPRLIDVMLLRLRFFDIAIRPFNLFGGLIFIIARLNLTSNTHSQQLLARHPP